MHSRGIRSGPKPDAAGAITTFRPATETTTPPCPGKRQTPEPPSNLSLESARPSQGSACGRTANGALTLYERTPSEILAEIFVITAKGLPVHFPPDFSSPQWVLSRTCSRWRNVALEESRLWNRIEIVATSMSPAAKLVAFIKSRICTFGLLSISVQDKEGCPSFSALVVEALIIPHLPRITALVLHLQSTGYALLFQAPPESFKSLELLDVTFDVINGSIIQASQNIMIFKQARALRRLKFINTFKEGSDRLCPNILQTSFPWHQFTELDLRLLRINVATVDRILRQCTSLQKFGVSVKSGGGGNTPAENLVLPHLRSLSLWLHGSCIFNPIVPALTELHLYGKWGPAFHTSITNMLSRSRCSLSVFDAQCEVELDPAMNASMLMECMPDVRVFKCEGLYVDKPTLEMIGRGQLLCSVTTLLCNVGYPLVFVDALMQRLELAEGVNSNMAVLRSAVGYYGWTHCSGARTWGDMKQAATRLEEINEKHGTLYSLEWKFEE